MSTATQPLTPLTPPSRLAPDDVYTIVARIASR
jgi:hypothetical protein